MLYKESSIMNYTFHPDIISFKKEDPDGKVLICLKKLQNRVVLNKTGYEIITMLPSFDNTEELLNELLRRYPSANSDMVEKDLLSVMTLLDIYGVVDMERPHSKYYECNIVGDDSYSRVSSFVLSTLRQSGFYYCRNTTEDYFEPVLMRSRFIQNYEYGVYIQDGVRITSYMTFVVLRPDISSVLSIGAFFFAGDIDERQIVNNFKDMIGKVTDIIIEHRPLTKVRIIIPRCVVTEKMSRILLNVGFSCECNLINESTQGDVIYFTIEINGGF